MAFEPNKIKYQHVIDAVKKINDEKIRLHPSTGYDVIINNKAYPPKEIIRISHQLAVGTDPGVIYGGEQVNKHLKNLGFEVRPKITIWKLGTNWGKASPSFYTFIKDEKIVIGTEKFNYKVGDLILITEGFTAHAIAKVKEPMIPITYNKYYRSICEELKIEYEDWVLFSSAEWYELPKPEIFVYQLQQGIRKIQNKDIQNKIINIWEYRSVTKNLKLFFYLKNQNEPSNPQWGYPCFILSPSSRDESGFKTYFILFLYKSESDRFEIGPIKILQRNSKRTSLPEGFRFLNNTYCSLGQTVEFYRRLKSEFPKQFLKILQALNDTAYNENIKKDFEKEEGFNKSLLKTSEAESILNNVKQLIKEEKKKIKYKFSFKYQISGATAEHKVDFAFNNENDLPNRFFCLVGKNGTGKTKYIAQLANKLINNTEEGSFEPVRPLFSKVITASFSYFDKFRFPKSTDVNYEFIGIKTNRGVQDETIVSKIVWEAYVKLSEDQIKKKLWTESILSSLETEYLNFDILELNSLSTRKDFVNKVDKIFSSGQKIVFQFITRLISVIENNSLLLFDEPETHLHPNIAGRMLRTIDNVLDQCNSFCILSTHSPIIVQEIPSKFIIVFDRQGNHPLIYSPAIECFGENLSNISNSIFRANEEKELYKIILEDLATKYTLEEIEEKFANKLSLNAQLFIQSIRKKK